MLKLGVKEGLPQAVDDPDKQALSFSLFAVAIETLVALPPTGQVDTLVLAGYEYLLKVYSA